MLPKPIIQFDFPTFIIGKKQTIFYQILNNNNRNTSSYKKGELNRPATWKSQFSPNFPHQFYQIIYIHYSQFAVLARLLRIQKPPHRLVINKWSYRKWNGETVLYISMWLTKFFNISIWKNILFLQVLFISLLVFSFHRNCYKGTNADFNLSWQKTEVLKEGSKKKTEKKQQLNTKNTEH